MASNWIDLTGGGGSGSWKTPVDTAASLPLAGNTVGDARAAEDTGVIYVWTGASWDTAVGGVGTVTSVGVAAPASILSVSGSPVTGAGTVTLGLANQSANQVWAGPVSGGAAAPSFRALDPADLPTFATDRLVITDGSGAIVTSPDIGINNLGGINSGIVVEPNNVPGGGQVTSFDANFEPLQNSPNEGYNVINTNIQIDPNSSGFSLGTSGNAVTAINVGINHDGTGDVGGLSSIMTNFQLGNGTDPISVKGIGYAFGFGNVAAGVTMDGPMQGYGFQPQVNAAATMGTNSYVVAFYDSANVACAMTNNYTSFAASPNVLSIPNNSNIGGVNISGNIGTLEGNSFYLGASVSPTITTIEGVNGGGFQGVNVNPTVTLNKGQAVGINVTMDNVTNYAGVQSSVVVQDLTFEFLLSGDNDVYTIEFANTTTAGNESISVAGTDITVNIESGVSTATQVKTAADNNVGFAQTISTTITGVGSNAQVTQAATNFTGGENPGTSKAAQFDGDVDIAGSLSFTGGLSIGALQSFATETILSGLGVSSIDTLITAPQIAANATITGTDLLAINTAMLLTIGDNASVTSTFLGYAALGLPAVLSMGAGSTIDRVEGAVFAISLDATATGGTADIVALCRSVAIPNGVTTINRLYGYEFSIPFGDPGTLTWGLYAPAASAHNYMGGDLKVGDTDLPANSSVGIELESTTKAFLPSRMTTAEKLALTAIAGMVVFDSTLSKLSYYDGTVWVNL